MQTKLEDLLKDEAKGFVCLKKALEIAEMEQAKAIANLKATIQELIATLDNRPLDIRTSWSNSENRRLG